MGRDRENGGGFIAVWRSIREHDSWFLQTGAPASPAEAWIDLLLLAAYRDHERTIDGEVVMLSRGELVTSQRILASRWGWTRKRARHFLDLREQAGEISQKGAHGGTHITICNYEKWQSVGPTEGPTKGPPGAHQGFKKGPTIRTKDRIRTKDNKHSFDRFWAEYPRKVGKLKAQAAWRRLRPPLDEVLAAIRRHKRSDQWQTEGGRFIPHPTTWLNRGGWQDEDGAATTQGGPKPGVY